MLISHKYSGYEIFYPENDKEISQVCHLILDGKYETIEKYKDTERNYVAKIKVLDRLYVLKSPKAETVIPQRRIQTVFKRGEALNTLYNLDRYREEGIDCFIVPRAAMVKKGTFIESSYLLMDFIDGEKLSTKEDIDEVLKIVKNIHLRGIYHGDLNTSNFIKTSSGIKAIDTQGKEEKIWNFKRAYDILTLKRDLLVKNSGYDVEKNYKLNRWSIGYLLAYMIKEFKYLSWVKNMRNLKKVLRNKGWKI